MKLKALIITCLPVLLFSMSLTCLQAATILGKVRDATGNEELISARVTIVELNKSVTTDNDGEFKFKDIDPGTYTISTSYLGYRAESKKVTVKKMDEEVKVNFLLKDTALTLKTVNVTGRLDKESDLGARNSMRNADNVTNVLSAKAIEVSPDITAANAVQRVSGVSLERSNTGDGRYAIIRGMDQRYNNTLISGVKMPSPDAKERFVPLDIIPSDLLQRIEVTKALLPSMEGDAIGGTLNLVMKDAPDSLLIAVNAATGYNQYLFNNKFTSFNPSSINMQDPSQLHGNSYQATPGDFTKDNLRFKYAQAPPDGVFGLTYGQRFLKNKLGVIVSASRQSLYSQTKSSYYAVSIDEGNRAQYNDYYGRQYSTNQVRTGLNAKLDYEFNANNKISLYNVFLQLEDIESRHTTDTSLSAFRTGPGTGYIFVYDRSRYQKQNLENVVLQGEHKILNQNVKLDWSGVYSIASSTTPDRAEVSNYFTIYPDFHKDGPYFDHVQRIWQKNNDRDYEAFGNATYNTPKILGANVELKAGALYRTKSRDNYQNEYQLNAVLDPVTHTTPGYYGIDNLSWTPYNPGGTPEYNVNNYTATENILAYYFQGKVKAGKLSVVGGVRMETTSQSYQTQAPVTVPYTAASVNYTDVLPGVHFKYDLDSRQNLRLSYFKSISRPGYYQLVPYRVKGEYYDELGNPFLKHTVADNLDFRYELYPNSNDVLFAGVFYKLIHDPIEYSLRFNGIYRSDYRPENFGNATNYGFEAVGIKYFGNFGISGNYTYTVSSITTTKILNDSATHTTYNKDETRPMQGQSKHILNAALLYVNKKSGTKAELAFVFTGRRIIQVSDYYGLDYYQKDQSLLDFSAEQRLGKRFTVFVKINNILNTPYEVALNDSKNTFVRRETYNTSYLGGLRYRL